MKNHRAVALKIPAHLMKALGVALVLTLGFGLMSEASAQKQIAIQKDHNVRIGLTASAGSVIVSNPKVADATVVDSRTIFIVGRGLGTAGITVTDSFGRTIWDGEVVVTLANANAVTVYRGVKPSVMICSTTCVEQNASEEGGANFTTIAPPTADAVAGTVH